MKIIEEKRVILRLEDNEILAFKHALQYVLHRLKEHHSTGALTVGKEQYVKGLLEELNDKIMKA